MGPIPAAFQASPGLPGEGSAFIFEDKDESSPQPFSGRSCEKIEWREAKSSLVARASNFPLSEFFLSFGEKRRRILEPRRYRGQP